MKLLVGLGNPGPKYARNRHNVGFMALDRIAETNGLGKWRTRFLSFTLEGELGGERVLLIKPQTYYNETGNAVREAAMFLKIEVSDIIVFHDEIDLAAGKLRVKTGGGLAGNNGLRSMQSQLNSPDFARVRIGVGHPGDKNKVAGYVLQDFSKADFGWLDVMLDTIAGSANRLAAGETERFQTSIAQAMSNLRLDDGEAAPVASGKTGGQTGQLPLSGQHKAASIPGDALSQIQLAKPGSGKLRKASRKIKKGMQAKEGEAFPAEARESKTAEAIASANPLGERLKRWFSGETNDS